MSIQFQNQDFMKLNKKKEDWNVSYLRLEWFKYECTYQRILRTEMLAQMFPCLFLFSFFLSSQILIEFIP